MRICLFAAAVFIALTGCQTGVESTPRITDKQVSRHVGAASAETALLSTIQGEKPSEWRPGKVFTLTGGKVSVAYTPSSVSSELQPGDTLRFESMTPSKTITGAQMTDFHFLTPAGQTVTYRMETSVDRLGDSVTLPFLVEASVIDSVRTLLKGRRVWTTTLQRYDLNGEAISGRKFQPVEITDVRAGRGEYPVEVLMGNEMIYLTVDPSSRVNRRFANLFSLTDPRRNYKQIIDRTWERICRGEVADGMTMEECRLALGSPREVERDATYGALIERWTYENGIYLLFSDGILTRFRR
ncbi:MAG: hypothetical protein HDS33_04160 [Bacteroides sp.]|nr:hypothetical protein [Bacteroides sp.]